MSVRTGPGTRTKMHTRASEALRGPLILPARRTADQDNRQGTDGSHHMISSRSPRDMLTNTRDAASQINASGRLPQTGSVTDRGHTVTLR